MESEVVKVVCETTVNGVTKISAVTTAPGNQGEHVISIVGVGNPFWAWPSIPPGRVIGAKFDEEPNIAPICTDDPAVNNALIAAITALPNDVLTYKTN